MSACTVSLVELNHMVVDFMFCEDMYWLFRTIEREGYKVSAVRLTDEYKLTIEGAILDIYQILYDLSAHFSSVDLY